VFVALGIQHAMRHIMRPVRLYSIFHISQKGMIFGKKALLNIKCVF